MTKSKIYLLLIWTAATFGLGTLIGTSIPVATAVNSVVAYTALLISLIAVFGKPWSK